MNVGSLTLRDLQYVVAVADHGHFGRAAQACAVSQPALSSQVRKLEGVLGVELFERTKRRVLVTPMGAEVAAQAREVLRGAQRLVETAQGRRELLAGPLALGAIATVGPYLLPYVLAPLRRRHPRLELTLREGVTHSLLQDLKAGTLDAVLASTPIHDPTLHVEPLLEEPFLVALPRGHPLTRRRRVSASELRPDDMVLLEDGHCLRDQALELCRHDRGGRSTRLQATSLETLRHMVAAGAGYSLIPALASSPGRLRRMVQYRPLRGSPGRTVALVWRRAFPRPGDLRALAALIRAHLPGSVAPCHPAGKPVTSEQAP